MIASEIEPVPVRIGTATGAIIAYDSAFDLCLFERTDGILESHEVGIFVPEIQERIRAAQPRT